MRSRAWLALYAVGYLLGGLGLAVTPLAVRDRALPAVPPIPREVSAARPEGPSIDSLVSRAPFRRDRRPPQVSYLEAMARVTADEAARHDVVSRPQWTLTGILWSDEPVALFDGVAGHPSTSALRVGERLGDLVIDGITPQQVTVAQGDSVWTYTLATPWR